jgi:hypothetical protein
MKRGRSDMTIDGLAFILVLILMALLGIVCLVRGGEVIVPDCASAHVTSPEIYE